MIKIEGLGSIVNAHRSADHVENCTIEEMSELTKAITKSRRGKVDIENITEEIGHVILMCYSLMYRYNITEYQILLEANDAVNRMLNNE